MCLSHHRIECHLQAQEEKCVRRKRRKRSQKSGGVDSWVVDALSLSKMQWAKACVQLVSVPLDVMNDADEPGPVRRTRPTLHRSTTSNIKEHKPCLRTVAVNQRERTSAKTARKVCGRPKRNQSHAGTSRTSRSREGQSRTTKRRPWQS